MTQEHQDSVIDFPCDFAIKAMGLAVDNFDALVVAIVRQHVPNLGEAAVSCKPSAAGKYLSVTISFEAESRAQLDNIYLALSAEKRVLMAL